MESIFTFQLCFGFPSLLTSYLCSCPGFVRSNYGRIMAHRQTLSLLSNSLSNSRPFLFYFTLRLFSFLDFWVWNCGTKGQRLKERNTKRYQSPKCKALCEPLWRPCFHFITLYEKRRRKMKLSSPRKKYNENLLDRREREIFFICSLPKLRSFLFLICSSIGREREKKHFHLIRKVFWQAFAHRIFGTWIETTKEVTLK